MFRVSQCVCVAAAAAECVRRVLCVLTQKKDGHARRVFKHFDECVPSKVLITYLHIVLYLHHRYVCFLL